jgi:ketosteroid isomerase-like protein
MKRNLYLFLPILFFLLTCQASDEDKIHQVLNRREEAFQKKDLSLYLSCISKSYQDKEEDFNQLKNRMEGYFHTFDQIRYSSWDRSLHIEGDTAMAIQQFQLEVEKETKKKRFLGKEALLLKKEGRDWKIMKGL